jgi:hypothetical protein
VRIWAALKIDEYVPARIPSSSARAKVAIVGGPSSSRAASGTMTVSEVMIDRPAVCRIEWLTIAPNDSLAWRTRFSRIRSKTTIVSCTLKPMIVSSAVTNSASNSKLKK